MSTLSVVAPQGAGAEFGARRRDVDLVYKALSARGEECDMVEIVDELLKEALAKVPTDPRKKFNEKIADYSKEKTRLGLRKTEEYKIKCNDTLQKPILECLGELYLQFTHHVNIDDKGRFVGSVMEGNKFMDKIRKYWDEFKGKYKKATEGSLGTAFPKYLRTYALPDWEKKQLQVYKVDLEQEKQKKQDEIDKITDLVAQVNAKIAAA